MYVFIHKDVFFVKAYNKMLYFFCLAGNPVLA